MKNSILTGPIPFYGRDGRDYVLCTLDRQLLQRNSSEIKAIHELIPYVGGRSNEFTEAELLSDLEPYRPQLTFAVTYQSTVVAFLTAYIRDYSDRHPFRSAYIHRLGVAKSHQRNHVGAHLLSMATSLYFDSMPWLLTVTVQTNNEPRNESVLSFYRRLGFIDRYRVDYPDKTDTLLEFGRASANTRGALYGDVDAALTGIAISTDVRLPDVFSSTPHIQEANVFFGTTSIEKLAQYGSILRSYGIGMRRLQSKVSLTEPQIDQSGPAAEAALVSGPLKLFSRFAALNTSFPVMIEDTMLFVEHVNNEYGAKPILPGPDTKRWWMALGAEGLLRLLGPSTKRAAKYVCQIGVNYAPSQYKVFRHEQLGQISSAVRSSTDSLRNFPYTNATFFHTIFVPDGSSRTLAEMDSNEFLRFDYRRACVAKALDLLRASGNRDPQLGLFRLY